MPCHRAVAPKVTEPEEPEIKKEIMANPPLDRCHKVENWSTLKLI